MYVGCNRLQLKVKVVGQRSRLNDTNCIMAITACIISLFIGEIEVKAQSQRSDQGQY